MLFIILLTTLACGVCVLLHYKYGNRSGVPTHPGWIPGLGHLHRINENGKNIKEIGENTTKHGGITAVYLGPFYHIYIISDPDDAITVMNKCLGKTFVYDSIKPWIGESIVTADVPTWKRNRKFIEAAFRQNVQESFIEIFNEKAADLVKHFKRDIGKGYVNLYKDIASNSVETVCRSISGLNADSVNISSEEYAEACEVMLQILTNRFKMPWLYFDSIFNLTSFKTLQDKQVAIVKRSSKQMVKLRKEEHLARLKNKGESRFNENKTRSFLDIILETSLTEDDQFFSDKELGDIVDNLMLAGFDTTAPQLFFILLYLGSHPDIQRKLYHEVINTIGTEEKPVTKEEFQVLPYLDAVVKEVTRICPVAPLIARQADTEVKLKNYTLPSGSFIAIHLWALNVHPSLWGDDAEEFKPERWLSENVPKHPAALATFAPGRRGCVGKVFALMNLKVTLLHIIRNFEIKSDISNMELTMNMTLKPISGHLIQLEKR